MKVTDDSTDIEIGCRNLQSTNGTVFSLSLASRCLPFFCKSPALSSLQAWVTTPRVCWSTGVCQNARPVTPDVSAYTHTGRDLGFFPWVEHGIYHLDRGHLALRNIVLFCSWYIVLFFYPLPSPPVRYIRFVYMFYVIEAPP